MVSLNGASRLDPLLLQDPFDVCIIGSGVAGTVLARSLVQRGVKTLLLESGRGLVQWFTDRRIKHLAAYEVSGSADYLTTKTKARALGGNSNFWTGRSERLHPSDFEDNDYTPEGSSWPFKYWDLEPYYALAETTLRVRGGELSCYHPPRNSPLPVPARADISGFKAMLAEAGVVMDESPTATPRRGLRVFRASKELLPDFLASSQGVLVSGVTVTRLIAEAGGRVTEAEVQTLDGRKGKARARRFVVCCGGIEGPRLLLLSRSESFPQGIGNGQGRVGLGFTEHPGVNFFGRVHHTWTTLTPRQKIGRSHQYYDAFKSRGLGAVLPVFRQSWLYIHHTAAFRKGQVLEGFGALAGRLKRPELYIGATIEMLPVDENRVTLAKEAKDPWGNPIAHLCFSYTEHDRRTLDATRDLIRDLFARLDAQSVRENDISWSRHHMGTCRMGDDPKNSVVDRNLRVHESPNLYVCGSETFVTGGAGPPVLTITALAHRLADHLTGR